MKEFILLLILIATPVSAQTKDQFTMNEVEFSSCGKECVEVKTRTVTYRVYACGKLEKLTWTELNPNEETLSHSSIMSITDPSGVTLVWDDATGNIIAIEQ